MTKIRKTIVILLTLAILCSLFVMVFAVGNANTENRSAVSMVNAYEYAMAPEGVYVFRYYGSDPAADLDIGTSECVVDRLYAHHSATGSVVEIFPQAVSDYTCTQTALYYVTAEQKVYKTDYTGTNHEYLYQCPQGAISMLSSYFDTLYFIEDQNRIMHLDITSKAVQEIWTYECLDWVFMLSDTQLIATTTEGEDYLYDVSTDTATRVSNIVATNMVTAAIKGTSSNNARSTTNPTANYADVVPTQENNVTFPLAEYWANPDGHYETSAPYRSIPTTWFHLNKQEGCNNEANCKRYSGSGECMGFAKYVHDVYAHMGGDTLRDFNGDGILNSTDDYYANREWENRTCMVKHSWMEDATDFDSSTLRLWPSNTSSDTTEIKKFFEGLNTGAYVRYGKYRADDSSPDDGCHSIVFIDSDDVGIWVYECNQDYDPNSSNDGCGVFIQYYPYNRLFRYKYILNYVNHNYSDNWGYLDKDYHSKGCSNCIGYVKKEHTSVSTSYIDTNNHKATFNCCGGVVVNATAHDDTTSTFINKSQHRTTYHCCGNSSALVTHTKSLVYSDTSASRHTVRSTCCSGSITEAHRYMYNEDNENECIYCGRTGGTILNIEDEEIN